MTESTTIEDVRAWYDRKHAALGVRAWRPAEAYAVFINLLKPRAGASLLDVGCGTGFLLADAVRHGLVVSGVDVSEQGIAVARAVAPGAEISQGEAERLPYRGGQFDYVTCLGVLEHLDDAVRGVREMSRVLKDDGTLLIMVPNSNYFFWKLHGIEGTDQQAIREHPRTKAEWVDIFRQAGVRPVFVTQDKWPMKVIHPLQEKYWFGMSKKALSKLIWFVMPLSWCYQFIFILKKDGPAHISHD